MQRQRELLQPRAHDLQEASGLGLVLESDDEIVGIAHDDHVARGLTPSPALSPEIEDVVQVDVGKKRRCHRPLPGPLVTNRHDPSSRMPARSHFWIRRIMRGSPIGASRSGPASLDWYAPSSARQRPIRSPLESCVQIFEPVFDPPRSLPISARPLQFGGLRLPAPELPHSIVDYDDLFLSESDPLG